MQAAGKRQFLARLLVFLARCGAPV